MSLTRHLITTGPSALLAALSIQVHAQNAPPTISIPADGRPAAQAPAQIQVQPQAPVRVQAPAAAAPGSATAPIPESATSGTTIVGDQESPIGLYITPWKDDYAERGLDRPARLVDEAMEPIDPATFRRQIEYYETITAFRKRQQGAAK